MRILIIMKINLDHAHFIWIIKIVGFILHIQYPHYICKIYKAVEKLRPVNKDHYYSKL